MLMVKVDKTSKKTTDKGFNKRLRNTLIGVVILVSCVFFADKFLFGYVDYYTNVIKCGHRPIVVGFIATTTGRYYKEGDSGYQISSLNSYLCTEQEAINKGYRHQQAGLLTNP
jgi:membrane-bound acyltransferase YfiQ involved in biofilm formation